MHVETKLSEVLLRRLRVDRRKKKGMGEGGQMDLFNFNRLKRPQLIELAGQVNIKGRHRLRKRELIRRLRKHLPALKNALESLRQPATVSVGTSTVFHTAAEPAVSPEPTGQPQFSDRGAPIPSHYGQDRITMMVRDPHWVFCYWELEGTAREQAAAEHGHDVFDGARWALRVHSSGLEHPHDIDVGADMNNWYLNVDDDGNYFAEIGVITRTGEFIALARSNRVHTPRSGMSDVGDTEWMTVEGDFRSVTRRVSGHVTVQAGAAERLTDRFRVHGLDSLFLGASRRASRIPPK